MTTATKLSAKFVRKNINIHWYQLGCHNVEEWNQQNNVGEWNQQTVLNKPIL